MLFEGQRSQAEIASELFRRLHTPEARTVLAGVIANDLTDKAFTIPAHLRPGALYLLVQHTEDRSVKLVATEFTLVDNSLNWHIDYVASLGEIHLGYLLTYQDGSADLVGLRNIEYRVSGPRDTWTFNFSFEFII